MDLNGYRIMWLFVFFDLPTEAKIDRRNASGFRNSLLSIPFGSFGLYAYTVTNNTSANLNSLTLIGALPDGVTNDTTRTTCVLDNKHGLSAGQSCLLVFKYAPTLRNSNSQFTISLAAYDDYYRVISSLPVSFPYSSR